MEQPDPAVGGVLPTLNQSATFELVEDAEERDRLNLQDLGEAALVNALVWGEEGQHLPL
jgi:hypothetical protein